MGVRQGAAGRSRAAQGRAREDDRGGERATLRGDPDKEARAWAAEIERIDLKRSGFQDMAAEGLIIFDELRSKLAALGETRKTAERELKVLSRRRQEIEALEQDANALLDSYAGQMPEDLDALDPEERHNVYKMLRLKVTAYPDRSLEVSGVFAKSLNVCSLETSPHLVL